MKSQVYKRLSHQDPFLWSRRSIERWRHQDAAHMLLHMQPLLQLRVFKLRHLLQDKHTISSLKKRCCCYIRKDLSPTQNFKLFFNMFRFCLLSSSLLSQPVTRLSFTNCGHIIIFKSHKHKLWSTETLSYSWRFWELFASSPSFVSCINNTVVSLWYQLTETLCSPCASSAAVWSCDHVWAECMYILVVGGPVSVLLLVEP